MSGHRHVREHGAHRHASPTSEATPDLQSSPLSRRAGAGSRAAMRDKVLVVSPTISPPTAAPVLPAEVYLVGCLGDASLLGNASALSLGNKAWNLLCMARLSLPVPPAFVIGTHYCVDPTARALAASRQIWSLGLQAVEQTTGLVLGDTRCPLLVSVRSGAPVSLPGMMETLLTSACATRPSTACSGRPAIPAWSGMPTGAWSRHMAKSWRECRRGASTMRRSRCSATATNATLTSLTSGL